MTDAWVVIYNGKLDFCAISPHRTGAIKKWLAFEHGKLDIAEEDVERLWEEHGSGAVVVQARVETLDGEHPLGEGFAHSEMVSIMRELTREVRQLNDALEQDVEEQPESGDGKDLRDLAQKIQEVASAHPCFSQAHRPVAMLIDHLCAIAAANERNREKP